MKIRWKKKKLKGFTLIEILVVVVIIGVLSAIALPAYMRSVEKSKAVEAVQALSDIAKGEHDYYLTKNRYSDDFDELSVSAFPEATGSEYESEYFTYRLEEERALANRKGEKYGYKLYRFYDDPLTYCEPEDNTYCKMLGLPSSDYVHSVGNWQSCPGGVYPCTQACSRSTMAGYSCQGRYNEDGSFSERVCDSNGYCVTTNFDANQKPINRMTCFGEVAIDPGYECNRASVMNYDEEGRLVSAYSCSLWVSSEAWGNNGGCKSPQAGQYYEYLKDGKITYECVKFKENGACDEWTTSETYRYDSDGNVIAHVTCNGDECTGTINEVNYDEKGNKIVTQCDTTGKGGQECKDGSVSVYNEKGDLLLTADCNKWDGTHCSQYGSAYVPEEGQYENSYGGNTEITSRECLHWDDSWKCDEYGDKAEMNIYDDNGRLVGTATCSHWDQDKGNCAGFDKEDLGTVNYYDKEGKLIATAYCKDRDETGMCRGMTGEGGTVNTYDSNGNLTSIAECVSWKSNGVCGETGATHYNYYDDKGNKINEIYCQEGNGTTCQNKTDNGTQYYDIQTGNLISSHNETEGTDEVYTYDKNGNLIITTQCEGGLAGPGTCGKEGTAHVNIYDSNGNMTGGMDCDGGIHDGYCEMWSNDKKNIDWYDMDGNLIGNWRGDDHLGYMHYYDENGNEIGSQGCMNWKAPGVCGDYTGQGYGSIYDSNGNKIADMPCADITTPKGCQKYGEEGGTAYTYDQNGNVTVSAGCTKWEKPGVCGEYSGSASINTYDSYGHVTNSTYCTWNGKECTGYADYGQANTYDASGNLTSAIECKKRDAKGDCLQGSGHVNTYDENGHLTTSGECTDWQNGVCRGYGSVTCYYTDKQGVQHEYSC